MEVCKDWQLRFFSFIAAFGSGNSILDFIEVTMLGWQVAIISSLITFPGTLELADRTMISPSSTSSKLSTRSLEELQESMNRDRQRLIALIRSALNEDSP